MGFITPMGGGDEVFVHRKVNGDDRSAYLSEGDEVEYEVEYDDRKGKYAASSCTGFKTGGGGGGGGGGGWGSGWYIQQLFTTSVASSYLIFCLYKSWVLSHLTCNK